MVGSHLLDYLVSETDFEIHCLLRWRSSLENIESHIDNVTFLHYGDLREELSLDLAIKKIKPNFIYHLAAQSFPKLASQVL